MSSLPVFADAVEALLREQCLKLTMGGEPTFIPMQPDTPEWTDAAMGSTKLGYARRLLGRLIDRLYPGAVVMQAAGKAYPGESAPRWALLGFHRKDGAPLWRKRDLFLLDDAPGANRGEGAQRFIAELAARLGVGKQVLACFEEQDPDTPRAWALPLDHGEAGWRTDEWPFSESGLPLVSGEGPAGFRLPLDMLGEEQLHRALTVEVTVGALQVFVPPLDWVAFEELVRNIERAATELGMGDIVLCGYRPSAHPEVSSLGLTPDPGVLEVNLPPSSCWHDYDRLLQTVTELAAEEGLQTTRMHFNGQVQGTGGGAHVLFGGPSLEANPFFARPDLLASIVRYWQRHPSLSYFFSGQYVGPGSQAPRADESSSSRLYELETACLGVDDLERGASPEMLDRLLLNLLSDAAGNTHRAELCLDKFCNRGVPGGEQGLIELRAFETMADAHDQSLSALFVRAIVAMLATAPRTGPFLRHGSRLHDAYMLPSWLWEDLGEICRDLQDVGLPFERQWLQGAFEFRFPVLGRLESKQGSVLVRQALEPWPVLAAQTRDGLTSRIVDNSTDRLELSTSLASSTAVTVNGVLLSFEPLQGRAVAGLRYKCADGWPALHPHVPAQVPLRLECLNERNQVVASARYYFWNPDGKDYEGRPADLAEAELRRMARWVEQPEEIGNLRRPVRGVYSDESAWTLDLRRQVR